MDARKHCKVCGDWLLFELEGGFCDAECQDTYFAWHKLNNSDGRTMKELLIERRRWKDKKEDE